MPTPLPLRGPFDTGPGPGPTGPPPTSDPPVSPDRLARMIEYSELFFEPETGRVYVANGNYTGFTFERARWSGPFGFGFLSPWLNPFDFATADTAEKVLAWARSLGTGLAIVIDDRQNILGPFTRTVERRVVVEARAEFNAGRLAESLIRKGPKAAAISWLAELRLNNIPVASPQSGPQR